MRSTTMDLSTLPLYRQKTWPHSPFLNCQFVQWKFQSRFRRGGKYTLYFRVWNEAFRYLNWFRVAGKKKELVIRCYCTEEQLPLHHIQIQTHLLEDLPRYCCDSVFHFVHISSWQCNSAVRALHEKNMSWRQGRDNADGNRRRVPICHGPSIQWAGLESREKTGFHFFFTPRCERGKSLLSNPCSWPPASASYGMPSQGDSIA